MTDRIKGFVVTLEQDVREDDVAAITDAIGMIRGVLSVDPSVVDHEDHMNRVRIRAEIQKRLWEAFTPGPGK